MQRGVDTFGRPRVHNVQHKLPGSFPMPFPNVQSVRSKPKPASPISAPPPSTPPATAPPPAALTVSAPETPGGDAIPYVVGTGALPTTLHDESDGPSTGTVTEGRFLLKYPMSKVGDDVRMRVQKVDPVTAEVTSSWMTVFRTEGGVPCRCVTFSAV